MYVGRGDFSVSFFFAAKSKVTRCVFEKVAQNVAQSIFCEHYYISVTVDKIAQLFGLLL
jgi:hypothetical protein